MALFNLIWPQADREEPSNFWHGVGCLETSSWKRVLLVLPMLGMLPLWTVILTHQMAVHAHMVEAFTQLTKLVIELFATHRIGHTKHRLNRSSTNLRVM